jgi:hypothetical protein
MYPYDIRGRQALHIQSTLSRESISIQYRIRFPKLIVQISQKEVPTPSHYPPHRPSTNTLLYTLNSSTLSSTPYNLALKSVTVPSIVAISNDKRSSSTRIACFCDAKSPGRSADASLIPSSCSLLWGVGVGDASSGDADADALSSTAACRVRGGEGEGEGDSDCGNCRGGPLRDGERDGERENCGGGGLVPGREEEDEGEDCSSGVTERRAGRGVGERSSGVSA